MESLIIIPILLVALSAYGLPTLIAYRRGHHQKNAIAILNIFVGWSGIFWVVALVWSFTYIPNQGERDSA